MYERPPRLAERVLTWALGGDENARSVLGDVSEDYAVQMRSHGRAIARIWYWKETLSLTASALLGRATGRPLTRVTTTKGEETVKEALSTLGFLHDARYALRSIRKDLVFFAFLATLFTAFFAGRFTPKSPSLVCFKSTQFTRNNQGENFTF